MKLSSYEAFRPPVIPSFAYTVKSWAERRNIVRVAYKVLSQSLRSLIECKSELGSVILSIFIHNQLNLPG